MQGFLENLRYIRETWIACLWFATSYVLWALANDPSHSGTFSTILMVWMQYSLVWFVCALVLISCFPQNLGYVDTWIGTKESGRFATLDTTPRKRRLLMTFAPFVLLYSIRRVHRGSV